MALTAGSVTVDQTTAAVTGTGIAHALMLGKVASWDAFEAAFSDGGGTPSVALKVRCFNAYKAECEAVAAALVPELSAADVRIATGAIDSGIPSVVRVLTGEV